MKNYKSYLQTCVNLEFFKPSLSSESRTKFVHTWTCLLHSCRSHSLYFCSQIFTMVFRQQSLTRTLRLIRTYFFSENGKNYPKTGPSHLSVSRFCKNHKHFSREYVSHTQYGFHDDCKYYFLGAIPLLIVYIYHKKYHILPSVKAATIKSDSPRSQFNFIADVVEGSTDSVVCIDIKNTQRYRRLKNWGRFLWMVLIFYFIFQIRFLLWDSTIHNG